MKTKKFKIFFLLVLTLLLLVCLTIYFLYSNNNNNDLKTILNQIESILNNKDLKITETFTGHIVNTINITEEEQKIFEYPIEIHNEYTKNSENKIYNTIEIEENQNTEPVLNIFFSTNLIQDIIVLFCCKDVQINQESFTIVTNTIKNINSDNLIFGLINKINQSENFKINQIEIPDLQIKIEYNRNSGGKIFLVFLGEIKIIGNLTTVNVEKETKIYEKTIQIKDLLIEQNIKIE